jgi:hypothetical protein
VRSCSGSLAATLGAAFVFALLVSGRPAGQRINPNADDLYRLREEPTRAQQAAEIWASHASTDFEAAWKLARAAYWIGTRGPEPGRRAALERGGSAGASAIRLRGDRPEGHFWLAANMGALAEASIIQGLRYRTRIKEELERVLAIDPAWQDGAADAALGEWYARVPRWLGGDRIKAESHLRAALKYDPNGRLALSGLAELLLADGRRKEAQVLLERVLAAPLDPEWLPEDREFREKAAARLKTLGITDRS